MLGFIHENGYKMKRTMVLLLMAMTLIFSVSLPLYSPAIAFAANATDGNYADELLSEDGKGNGAIGWNEDVIKSIDGYDDTYEDNPGGIVDQLWKLLRALTVTFLGTIITVFVVKIVGRVAYNLLLGDTGEVPSFFKAADERGKSVETGGNNVKWFGSMCKEFATFFGVAAGTVFILGVIVGLMLMLFNQLPSDMGDFFAFGISVT